VEKTDKQPGKLWGNIFFECFLSLALVFGAALAISWPYKSAQLLTLLKRPHFYYSFIVAFCLAMQLFSLTLLTCGYLDEKLKWEDNFLKRFLIQASAGSIIPFILMVIITYLCSLLYATNVIAPLYSRHFIGFSMSISFAFNAMVSGYKYAREKERPLIIEKDAAETAPEILAPVVTYPKYLWAKYGEQKFKLYLDEIAYFQIIDKIVLIYYSDNITYTVRYSLTYLKSILNPRQFMKINRAFLVNRKAISSYKSREKGGLQLFLKHKEKEIELSVSANMAQRVVKWMEERTYLKPPSFAPALLCLIAR
jgi:hypothetical protein